jgi:hypothetical protein
MNGLRSELRLYAAFVKQNLRQLSQVPKILRAYNGDRPIFVYQMGKVGSTNLYEGANEQRGESSFFHLHRVNREFIRKLKESYNSNAISPYFFYNFSALRMAPILKNERGRGRVRILCPIREPLTRNVSHFFHDIERFYNWRSPPRGVDDLAEMFERKFEHWYPDAWFSEEFKKTTDVDVFSEPFPKSRGLKYIQQISMIFFYSR